MSSRKSGSIARNFTPGPWRANLHHTQVQAGRTFGFILADAVVPIAAVTLGVEGMTQDEGRGNAALIAAAPDLYGALEEMLFNFKRPQRSEWLNEAGFERAINACATAERALAKARGKETP